MTEVLEAVGLGKRFGRKWALGSCDLALPAGRVAGLVGPNGAGKSTLIHLAVGLLRPSSGSIAVLGGRPGSTPEQLARVGFVAQETPTYAGLSIADHLRFGAWANPAWDGALAAARIERLGLDPAERAGRLSGGQRVELALTLAVAKRPDLLVLDEPVASLDPLARREFLQDLMEVVADHGTSVLLSSHLVADLERVCDHLVVLVDSHVRVAGDIDELLASHRRLTGPRIRPGALPSEQQLVGARHTDRQSTLVVRTDRPILDPAWSVEQLDLEDLVLAYMTRVVDPERLSSAGGPVVIRVALRQFRVEAITAAVVLGAVAIVLAINGPHLAHVSDAFVQQCRQRRLGECGASGANPVVGDEHWLQNAVPPLLIVAPALAGLFFGAPLVAREFETGTYRLAWTQSVTRTRRLAAKLAPVGLASMALAGLLTFMANWWSSPIDAANANRFQPAQFSVHGVAPVGYAAFAFALGVAAGVLVRRTIPAMAVTLAGFAAARLAFTAWVRRGLATPVRESLPLSAIYGPKGPGFGFSGPGRVSIGGYVPNISDAWVYSAKVVNRAGRVPTSRELVHACPVLAQVSRDLGKDGGNPAGGPGPAQLVACGHVLARTLHVVVTYQPAYRFWPFQWAEMGIFLAAAVALAGLSAWWLRHRCG